MNPSRPSLNQSASEARFDPVSANWILYSVGRRERPIEYQKAPESLDTQPPCPFCPDYEHQTPPTLWSGKEKAGQIYSNERSASNNPLGSNDWSVRVFANRYPALSSDSCREKVNKTGNDEYFLQTVGGHEVIVDTRQHTDLIAQTTVGESRLLFLAIRDRINTWNENNGIEHISVFKNSGGAAGASMTHSHCQLIATNYLPGNIQHQLQRMNSHLHQVGECLICSMTNSEIADRERVICETEEVIAYSPYASAFPFQVRLTSKTHLAQFEKLSDATLHECAILTRNLIIALQEMHPTVSYNLIFSTLPKKQHSHRKAFHWSIDLCPRITSFAGYEIATGSMINTVLPEDAARTYRSCIKKKGFES